MFFESWRQRRAAKRRSPFSRRCSVRPQVEPLEDRVVPAGGTWTPLTNTDLQGTTGLMLLLPDGTVMVQGGVLAVPGGNASNTWEKLTPSASGSYIDGTWSDLASMSLERLYYTTDVLPSGKVFLLGGEQTGADNAYTWTNTGEMYDPISNTWSSIANYPQSNFGDDPSEVLPDGRILLGSLTTPDTFIYDPATDSYTQSATKLNNDQSDEETWVKLKDGSILSFDIFNSIDNGPPYTAQRYIPSMNQWVATGDVPENLSGSNVGYELGPALLLPDGRAFFVGATSTTAIYDPTTDSWTAGPALPPNMGNDDGPGAILPDGQVIFTADTSQPQIYTPPTVLFDFDPATDSLTQLSTPAALTSQLNESAYYDQMLVLPTGQLLLTTGSNQLWVYTPDTPPNPSWQPTISSIVNNAGAFTLTGTQLNGMSEGADYGDDAEMAENYPIVSLTDASGQVTYARTFNWSSTGVQTGSTPVTTQFTDAAVPGAYLLSVSAAGISSNNVLFVQMGDGADNVTLQVDPNNSGNVEVVQDGSTVLGSFPLASFSSIIVDGDGGTDTLALNTANGNFIPAGGLSYDGGGGTATLIGPNATNTWNITGTNSGALDSNVTFTNVPNLTGGSGKDTFLFAPAGSITGNLDGGAGTDTLGTDAVGAEVSITGPGTIDGYMGNTGGTGSYIGGTFDNIEIVQVQPAISGVSPASGPQNGGTAVIITGSGFLWTTAASFGGAAASFTIDSNTQITATSPTGSPGLVDVTVTTAGGTSAVSSADQFDYLAPLSLSPAALSAGTANQSYSATIIASGGSGNYTFALTAGSLPLGMSLANDGALTGTPTTAGTYSFTVTASDDSITGLDGSQPYSLVINPAASLTLSPTMLATATVKNPYGPVQFGATGGYGSYTFVLASGSKLPSGLTLSSAGVLSGQPTTTGTSSFTVVATDSTMHSLTGSLAETLKVDPAISIGPATLAVTTAGDLVNDKLTASGGSGSGYTYSLSSGSSPPPGLTVGATGVISGTPTMAGKFTFTVVATDSIGAAGSRSYTLTVDPAVVVQPPASIPIATVGNKYAANVQFSASGGSGTGYTFAATGLPSGLTVSSTGILSGTPTGGISKPTTYTVTVTARDSQKGTGTTTFSLILDPAIVLGPTTLPVATIGDNFSQVLTATGGSGSGYTYALAGGSSLPSGLSLDDGIINGKATTSGTYTFTIVATDGIGATGSRTYTMTVDPAIVIAPTTLPAATIGTKYTQTLTATGGSGSGYSWKASGLPSWLILSSRGTLSGTPPAGAPAQITFTVTVTDSKKGAATMQFTLTINV